MRLSLRSTSTRTFAAIPAAVFVEQALARRPLRPVGVPLLLAGYLTYRLAGRYRLPRAGGPAGMSQGMPHRLVREGPYAWTRNPMYLGHLVFLTGLALSTRSPLATAVALAHVPWFRDRVRRDEARLLAEFGDDYARYVETVPRWVPQPPRGR